MPSPKNTMMILLASLILLNLPLEARSFHVSPLYSRIRTVGVPTRGAFPSDNTVALSLKNVEKVEEVAAWQDQLNNITSPVQDVLDNASEGWALSYADLSPDTESSIPGIAFLLTNVAYAAAGLVLTLRGDVWFGLVTDVTAIISFNYHYNQLQVQGDMEATSVRLALLIDYVFASVAILTGFFYLLTSPTFPLEGAAYAAASLVFLGLCWVYEKGRTYMVLHGMWHLLSAYAGYLIGASHMGT